MVCKCRSSIPFSSGEQALNLPIAHGQGDTFNGGANVGPITATGSDSADTGESASDNGTIWVGTPDPAGSGPAVLNGTDEQSVTISDLALGSNFRHSRAAYDERRGYHVRAIRCQPNADS